MEEHLQLLDTFHTLVPPTSEVVLDVTHGLRHLPLLTFTAALYLRATRRASIQAIYYGAFDLRSFYKGLVPVLRLDGLLEIVDWVQAIRTFDDTGNFGVFADLLRAAGLSAEAVRLLRQASLHAQLFRYRTTQAYLEKFLPELDRPLKPPGSLFRQRLKKALQWIPKADLYEYQRRRAFRALERYDFAEAALFGLEAFITRLVDLQTEDPFDEETRKVALEEFKAGMRGDQHLTSDFETLTDIRVAFAHPGAVEASRPLPLSQDYEELYRLMKSILERLLPKIPGTTIS